MSQKSKKHFWGEIQNDSKEQLEPLLGKQEATHITLMDTPLYVCDHPNNRDRVLRIIPRSSKVHVLSEKMDSWIQIETVDGTYIKGFTMPMFLKEIEEPYG